MILKDFNNRKKEIKAHVEAGYLEEALESCIELVEELFQEKKYSKIVEVYQSTLISNEHLFLGGGQVSDWLLMVRGVKSPIDF